MDVIMPSNIDLFAARYQLKILGSLGDGIHGSVFEVADPRYGKSAVKIHHELEHFAREFDVYIRLDEFNVDQVCGFWVPQLLRADEDFLALQMTIVTRPFVLDFAGAFVDAKPKFSDEVWANWEIEKRDLFGDRWAKVCEVIEALEEMDIYYVDVTPANIAFRD
jgi:hypothetical protein